MVAVRQTELDGLEAVELRDGNVRIIVVTSVGPRIAWFGPEAENLLYWNPAADVRHGAWRLRGGHRLWVTRPLADETEESYAPDERRCHVEAIPDGIRATAPATDLGIERTLAVAVRAGTWTVTHELRNAADMLWSGGAWALTCTSPSRDTRYRIPLGGGPPRWDIATLVIPTRWGGSHTSRLDDPQFTLTADALEARAEAREGKRMVLAPRGLVEMRDARGTFRKHAPFDRAGTYPLGTNLAVYIAPDGSMVELESMGPQRCLAPGERLSHVEEWTLA